MPSHVVDLIRGLPEKGTAAVVSGEIGLTCEELLDAAGGWAALVGEKLGSKGPGRVLRIGVHLPSGIDYIIAALAVLDAGACFVPVPDELADAEKLDLVERTALDGILTLEEESKSAWMFPFQGFALDLGSRESRQRRFWLGVGTQVAATFPEERFAAMNPAFIRFSSGTTGQSKGVVLSHESLIERITAANAGLQIGPADRVLWTLPMAHHFAVSIMLYLCHGATTLLAEAATGEERLDLARAQGATVMYGSPFHFRQLLGTNDSAGWPTLRLAISTAAALDAETGQAFQRRFGTPLTQGLGIIEAGLPFLNLAQASTKPESIGRPLPDWEARLRNEGDGAGELLLRGPGFFDAYLDPWQPRAEVLDADGWFATGDLAEADADGDFFLRGRLKSLINVGGMKVFPEEVERVLSTHPGVDRALVSAQSQSVFGEVPVAHYTPTTGPVPSTELRRHCRESLAMHKVPVAFTAVEALPTTASGKLRRPPFETISTQDATT